MPQIFQVFQNEEAHAKWGYTKDQLAEVVAAFTTKPDDQLSRLGKALADEESRQEFLQNQENTRAEVLNSRVEEMKKIERKKGNNITRPAASPARLVELSPWFSGSPLQCYIFRRHYVEEKESLPSEVANLQNNIIGERIPRGWGKNDSRWDKEGPQFDLAEKDT